MHRTATALAFALLLPACAHEAAPAPKAADNTPPPVTIADQLTLGQKVFGDECAMCHGDAGQGGKKAPPVVGASALPLDPRPGQKRDVQFHTALDIAKWVKGHMPPDSPGGLSDEQYFAVLAFDLKANGVDLKDKVTPDNAASFVIHP